MVNSDGWREFGALTVEAGKAAWHAFREPYTMAKREVWWRRHQTQMRELPCMNCGHPGCHRLAEQLVYRCDDEVEAACQGHVWHVRDRLIRQSPEAFRRYCELTRG